MQNPIQGDVVLFIQGTPYFDPPQSIPAVVRSTTEDSARPNLALVGGAPEDTTMMKEFDTYRPAVEYDRNGGAGTWRWPHEA